MSSTPAERRTRPDLADWAVVAITIAAGAALLWLGRGLTFFADEWAVIGDRPIGIETFFRPFNEHWLGVQTLVYRAMVETLGLTSYVPYVAALTALHLVVVGQVYVLARQATYPAIAVGVALVVAFFGSGFENLFWAMQIGFIGAIALGFGALLVLDGGTSPRRVAIAVAMLTVAIMTSGFGLFMLGLVGLDAVLDRRRWRVVPWLAIPGLVYLGWYLTIGRTGLATHGDPFTTETLLAVPGFVVGGVTEAFASAFGAGRVGGGLLILGLVALIVVQAIRRRSIPSRGLAYLGAIVGMYALLGVVRVGLETDATYYSRYSYLSGMFALLGTVTVVGRPTIPPGRPRLLAVAALAAVLVLSLLWNVRLLMAGRALFAERADLTRAMVELGLSEPLPDGVRADLSLVLVPSPVRLHAIVERFGSPLDDRLAGDAVPPIPEAARVEALERATNPPDWLLEQPWLP